MPRSVFPSRALPASVAALTLVGWGAMFAPVASAAPADAAAAQGGAPQGVVQQTPTTQTVVAQGTIRDPDGKTVKGATVSVLNVTEEGEVLPQTFAQTDEEGHFAVESQLSTPFLNAMRHALGMGDKELRAVAIIHAPGFAVTQKLINGAGEKGPNLPANEIALKRGFSATGQVVDADGKPLAGVKVQASSVTIDGVSNDSFDRVIWLQGLPSTSPIMQDMQAVSDTTGHFTLRDLPLGKVTVTLSDPRFVGNSADLTVSEAPPKADTETKITARSAASVRGRVLFPDGKPAGGVTVTARATARTTRGLPNTANTKPDGTYEIGGLMAGEVVLTVAPPAPEWAVTAAPAFSLKGDDTNRAEDITLSHGVLLTGFVREDRTQNPVAGATISATLTSNATASAITNAEGRYQIRVPVGDIRFYLNDTPSGFAQSFGSSTQLSVGEQSRVAPDFSVQRSLILTGTAKDEKGQPATGAIISVRNAGPTLTATVDAQGNWTLRGINPRSSGDPNNVSVKLQIDGEWDLRSNANVKLPSPPLNLTLARVKLQDVTVRVVTPQGQPIAGANVQYRIATDAEKNNWTLGNIVSNAQGEVILPKLKPSQSALLTATKQGYTQTQRGKVSSAGGANNQANPVAGNALLASDIVMAPLDAKVTGRVLDAQGQPAKGARVALLFPTDLRDLPDSSVLTNDQGQFTLEGLPQGEVTLGVAQGRAFGQATIKANGTAELKLSEAAPVSAPQNTEAAFTLLERWGKEVRANNGNVNGGNAYDFSSFALSLLTSDPDRALRVVTDDNGKVNQSFAQIAPLRLAQNDPQHALEWGKKVIPFIEDAETRIAAQLQIATLTASVHPADAQQVYEATAANTTPTDLSPQSALKYARLAALASTLKNPDAEGWLQALNLCLTTMPEDTRDEYLSNTAGILAEGDLAGARKWATQLPSMTQLRILSGFVDWAAKHNITAAQQILGDMETLIKRPDFPVAPPRTDGRYSPTASDTLNAARQKVVRALMTTNLKAAQELSKRLSAGYTSDLNLQAQIIAQQTGPADQDAVQTALSGAREDWEHPAGSLAFIAALINDKLPQLSADTFKEARTKLGQHADNGRGDDGETAAYYAYARANSDPAESRLLLENDWLRTINKIRQAKNGPKEDQTNSWELTSRLVQIARAMIVLDIARADEMVSAAKQDDEDFSYYGSQVRSRMIAWLLADALTRRTKPLGNPYEQDEDN